MQRLLDELHRLYAPADGLWCDEAIAAGLAGGAPAALPLVTADGRCRAMLFEVAHSAGWDAVAALCRGLQDELELPAPAVAVVPDVGYQVWLSLRQSIDLSAAERFMAGLAGKFLAGLPAAKWRARPDASDVTVPCVPARHAAADLWSAFIDPGMGSLFADACGLDMAPGAERQADMLAGLKGIGEADFARVLAQLSAVPEFAGTAVPNEAAGEGRLALGGGFADPRTFLLAVMNDPAASARLRVEAAKALLPYCPPAGQ